MQSRELIEVASMVATHGPLLVAGPARLSPSALEQYWVASKCRTDRWTRTLKHLTAASRGEQPPPAELLAQFRPICEEIMLAEMVLRVWTAVLYAYDRRRGTDDAMPIARSVLLTHLEIRQRMLSLLVHSPSIDIEDAVLINRLRRRVERWTDFLLGHLSTGFTTEEFAFDAIRVAEFADDLNYEGYGAAGQQAWALSVASLRVAFQQGLSGNTPNPDANRDIAASILACFPSELFDSIGSFRSLWEVRLTHGASDVQGMVDQLLHDETTPSGAGRSTRRRFR